MQAFTARNWNIDKAPGRIELLGDKQKRAEPAQHVIEFPGGAIEVSRTSDGNYWAHIIVNQAQRLDDAEGREASFGQIVGAHLCATGQMGVAELPNAERITQISVLIQPVCDLAAAMGEAPAAEARWR